MTFYLKLYHYLSWWDATIMKKNMSSAKMYISYIVILYLGTSGFVNLYPDPGIFQAGTWVLLVSLQQNHIFIVNCIIPMRTFTRMIRIYRNYHIRPYTCPWEGSLNIQKYQQVWHKVKAVLKYFYHMIFKQHLKLHSKDTQHSHYQLDSKQLWHFRSKN